MLLNSEAITLLCIDCRVTSNKPILLLAMTLSSKQPLITNIFNRSDAETLFSMTIQNKSQIQRPKLVHRPISNGKRLFLSL